MAPEGRLQIVKGTEAEIYALVEKMFRIYQDLSWSPWCEPTEEGDMEQFGCEASFDDLTVRLFPLWWGTWIVQYRTNDPSHDLMHAAIHDGHEFYPKIKTVQNYGWRQSKANQTEPATY